MKRYNTKCVSPAQASDAAAVALEQLDQDERQRAERRQNSWAQHRAVDAKLLGLASPITDQECAASARFPMLDLTPVHTLLASISFTDR